MRVRMIYSLMLVFLLTSSIGWAKLPEFTDLAKKAGPAVVNISTVKEIDTSKELKQFFRPFGGKDSPFGDFFDRFFGNTPPRKQKALGSGFIISKDGYIVTNYHVVKKADKIQVILQGKKQSYPAKIIGKDPETDLALIKIEADRDLPTLKFGNSEDIQKGDWVVAIGNPFGLDHTVTAGIISAKGRVIGAGPYDNFLQTDASINPGNSGGPLLNMEGEVVGINTAIVASGQGIGFAIPSNIAKDVIDQLKKYKKVKRGWLGVTIQDVDENTAKALGLSEAKGALVASVREGDPADKAGIKVGDVIVSVNGSPIDDARDITITIGKMSPGQKIDLKVWRKGEIRNFEVKLGKRGEQLAQTQGQEKMTNSGLLGMELKSVNQREAEALGLPAVRGLLVTEVKSGSPAESADMRRGDVIWKANGHPVNSISEFRRILSKATKEKGVVLLLIKRHGQNLFRTIPLNNK